MWTDQATRPSRTHRAARRGHTHQHKVEQLGVPLQRVHVVRPLGELRLGRVRVPDDEGLCAHDQVLLVLDGELQGRGDAHRRRREVLVRPRRCHPDTAEGKHRAPGPDGDEHGGDRHPHPAMSRWTARGAIPTSLRGALRRPPRGPSHQSRLPRRNKSSSPRPFMSQVSRTTDNGLPSRPQRRHNFATRCNRATVRADDVRPVQPLPAPSPVWQPFCDPIATSKDHTSRVDRFIPPTPSTAPGTS